MQWTVSPTAEERETNHLSKRGSYDSRALALVDRHYSRSEKMRGHPQFGRACKNLVFVRLSDREISDHGKLAGADAAWMTSWPYAEYAFSAWNGEFPNNHSVIEIRPQSVDEFGEFQHRPGSPTKIPRAFIRWVDEDPTKIISKIKTKRGVSKVVWVRDAWVHETPGTWDCSFFRNESGVLSSLLIRQAVAATRAHWGDPPPGGMITMIQDEAVRSFRDGVGFSYEQAGFVLVGRTKSEPTKSVFQLLPEDMPPARLARGDVV